jgi:hypothetical protein
VGDLAAARRALVPNTNALEGVRAVDGYDGGLLLSQAWSRTMGSLLGDPSFHPLDTARSNINGMGGRALNARLLAELDVGYVVAHDPRFDVGRFLPPGSRRVATDAAYELWRVPGGHPVYLEDGSVPTGLRLTRDPRRPEHLVVDVPASAAGRTVVVSEAMAPGWHSDGHVAVRREQGFLMAFTAPAGGGRVRLSYTTPGLRLGGLLSAISIVALVALAVAGGRGVRQKFSTSERRR